MSGTNVTHFRGSHTVVLLPSGCFRVASPSLLANMDTSLSKVVVLWTYACITSHLNDVICVIDAARLITNHCDDLCIVGAFVAISIAPSSLYFCATSRLGRRSPGSAFLSSSTNLDPNTRVPFDTRCLHPGKQVHGHHALAYLDEGTVL